MAATNSNPSKPQGRLKPSAPLCLLLGVILSCATSKILPTDAKWEADIQAFEAADLASPVPPGGILFIGSSSIHRWESLTSDFPGLPVVNRGFGGSHIIDSVFFADRIVLPYAPKTILLYAGDNDIADGKTAGAVLKDFQRFARKVHQTLPKTRILFISIKPSLKRWHLAPEMAKANAQIRDFTQNDNRLDFVDIWIPMLDKTRRPEKSLFVDDGLHINRKGYQLWKEAILPWL